MNEVAIKPEMVTTRDTDPAVLGRIKIIDRAIHRSPEEFQTALTELGDTALANTLAYAGLKDRRTPHATRTPRALVTEYIENRYDGEHDFDPETEAAFKKDQELADLVQYAQRQRNEKVKTGIMRSESRANPNALPAVEQVRRYRFSAYLSRVAVYQSRVGAESGLPSTGTG